MDKEKLVEYFENYIKKYPPYKNDQLFTGLCNYLVDYYYDDVYNKVPSDLKSIFENQEQLTSVYDKFLIAIGVPREIINKLNYNEKIIFLRSLSDFRRYKGTVEFIRKIGKSFTDSFNVYELYIDWDEVNGWCFKPVIIYKDENLEVVDEIIEYQKIYDAVPGFFIDQEQMEQLRVSSEVTLPIKSNILLLDQKIIDEVSIINSLIISTFIKEYGDSYVNIYFSSEQYTLSFRVINYLWYYLTTRYYGTDWLASDILHMLRFDEFHGYSIFELDDLLSQYEALENNAEIHQFYQDMIAGPYLQYFKKSAAKVDPTMAEENDGVISLKNTLENIDAAFSSYIEDRIENSGDANKEISNIITEIYNSLLLYRDTYSSSSATGSDPFLKYYDYFLSSLPQLTINPEDTTSYTLIYNFKPYHTELFSIISNIITSKDKFNSVVTSDDHYFLFEMIKYDILSLLDERVIQLELHKQSNLDLISAVQFIQEIELTDEWLMLDQINAHVQMSVGDTIDVTAFMRTIYDELNSNDSLSIISAKGFGSEFTFIDEPLDIQTTYDISVTLSLERLFEWNLYEMASPLTLESSTIVSHTGSSDGNVKSELFTTEGNWYTEFNVTGGGLTSSSYHLGVSNEAHDNDIVLGFDANQIGVALEAYNGRLYHDGSYNDIGFTFDENDVIMMAWMNHNGKVWFGKNGVWYGGGDPATGSLATYQEPELVRKNIYVSATLGDNSHKVELKSLSGELVYTPPSGFLSISYLDPETNNGLDPNRAASNLTITNRKTVVVNADNVDSSVHSSRSHYKGVWYWEVVATTGSMDNGWIMGVALDTASHSQRPGGTIDNDSWGAWHQGSEMRSLFGGSYSTFQVDPYEPLRNDVIGFILNLETQQLLMSNRTAGGSWVRVDIQSPIVTGAYHISTHMRYAGSSWYVNTKREDMEFPIPDGAEAWDPSNIVEISEPSYISGLFNGSDGDPLPTTFWEGE